MVSRIQRTLLAVGLAGWILLGLAHTVVVMAGPRGWRPDRSAPGAEMVIGHPDDTDPMLVAGPRTLAEATRPTDHVFVLLPADLDSTSFLYARYQLAHVLYPRRVRVARATTPEVVARAAADSALLIAAPGVAEPAGCRAAASETGYRALECSAP